MTNWGSVAATGWISFAALVGMIVLTALLARGSSRTALLLAWPLALTGHALGLREEFDWGRTQILCFYSVGLLVTGFFVLLRDGRRAVLRLLLIGLTPVVSWLAMGGLAVDSIFGGENWVTTQLRYSELLLVSVVAMDATMIARLLTLVKVRVLPAASSGRLLFLGGGIALISWLDFTRYQLWSVRQEDLLIMTSASRAVAVVVVFCHIYVTTVFLVSLLDDWLTRRSES